MTAFFTYILQSTAILSLFWLIYMLFLRKDTLFKMQRTFLLSGLGLSAVLPLLDFPLSMKAGEDGRFAYLLEAVVVTPGEMRNNLLESTFPVTWLQAGYFMVTTGLFIVFAFRVFRIIAIIRKNKRVRETGIIVEIPNDWAPFSFFGYIFLNKNKYEERHLESIRLHEQVHVKQWHSADVVLLEILLALHWFNPLFWYYRKSLKNIHEYLADREVVESGHPLTEYQQLIFAESTGIPVSAMSNNFSRSLIKRRIIMMKRKTNRKQAVLKYLLISPVALMLAFLFTVTPGKELFSQAGGELPPAPPKAGKAPAIGEAAPQDPAAPQKEEQVFIVVHKMPEFKDGQKGLQNYIFENLSYPEEARIEGIEGKVYVSYIVKKTGEVTGVKVVRGASDILDKEAYRVVKEMPDWKPGENEAGEKVNVQMTLPILFDLGEEQKEEK